MHLKTLSTRDDERQVFGGEARKVRRKAGKQMLGIVDEHQHLLAGNLRAEHFRRRTAWLLTYL